MISSVSSSAAVTAWNQPQSQRPQAIAKTRHHEKQDTVQLSQEAQKAAESQRQSAKR